MSATHPSDDLSALNLREQLARIDQKLADRDLKLQSARFAPWQLAIGFMTAGAALFAAGAAFTKIFGA